MSFEEIEHTADRAFRVRGLDLADLAVNAVRAMHALEGVRPTMGKPVTRELEVEGIDPESLLVNWLNEILFLEQEYQVVCEEFEIHELKGYHLRARVKARECTDYRSDVKAVTFHNLKIGKTAAGLEAELVLDV